MAAKNKPALKPREKARRIRQITERIRRAMRIESLADYGPDYIDMRRISVAQVRAAIAIAFDAGFESGFKVARDLHRSARP